MERVDCAHFYLPIKRFFINLYVQKKLCEKDGFVADYSNKSTSLYV